MRSGNFNQPNDKFNHMSKFVNDFPPEEENIRNQHMGKINNEFPYNGKSNDKFPHIGKISDIFPQREETPGNERKGKIDNDLPLIEDVIKQRKISSNEDFPLGKEILGNKHIWSD